MHSFHFLSSRLDFVGLGGASCWTRAETSWWAEIKGRNQSWLSSFERDLHLFSLFGQNIYPRCYTEKSRYSSLHCGGGGGCGLRGEWDKTRWGPRSEGNLIVTLDDPGSLFSSPITLFPVLPCTSGLQSFALLSLLAISSKVSVDCKEVLEAHLAYGESSTVSELNSSKRSSILVDIDDDEWKKFTH